MKINIYYGGRGLIDDPTLYVINKMQEVLEEIHVTVERFNLYELKNNIVTLPQTLKDADGIILATTVEWYGIGGYMQQFLDACWLYGDKEKISTIYMCPIVMSTTHGEQEGKLNLITAWQILGGLPCSGLSGYITDTVVLEMNEDYNRLIEKKAENIYRCINQKMPSLPTSNQAVKTKITLTKSMDLTPEESEQLSQYASDDSYVQRQKEDIQELTSMFRNMMEHKEEDGNKFLKAFVEAFKPAAGLKAVYRFHLDGQKEPLVIKVEGPDLSVRYEDVDKADVEVQMKTETLDEIMHARTTFQRAFMGGEMKLKGDFAVLRTLDQIFVFE